MESLTKEQKNALSNLNEARLMILSNLESFVVGYGDLDLQIIIHAGIDVVGCGLPEVPGLFKKPNDCEIESIEILYQLDNIGLYKIPCNRKNKKALKMWESSESVRLKKEWMKIASGIEEYLKKFN